MGLRTPNPTSAGQRGRIAPDFAELTKGARPTEGAHSSPSPRPAAATTTGASPRASAAVATSSATASSTSSGTRSACPPRCVSIEYDPNRTARIALLHYADGEKRYILAPVGLNVGDTVISSRNADIKPGNSLPLRFIPLGTMIHNVELKIGGGAQLVRSAGSRRPAHGEGGRLGSAPPALGRGPQRPPRLPRHHRPGRQRRAQRHPRAARPAARAGCGRRPHNRGVTMNPVDHPMGGGEGRTSGGRHPCSPWGQLTKGLKTRKNKRTDKMIVKRRGQKV